MKYCFVTLTIIIFLCSGTDLLSKNDSADLERTANNIIYPEIAAIIFPVGTSGYYSLNYERIFADQFSVRIGYGRSSARGLAGHGGWSNDYEGFTTLLNYFSRNTSKINFSLGISLLQEEHEDQLSIIPAASITYRYQPRNRGMYFSIGGTFNFGVGGINLSLGSIF